MLITDGVTQLRPLRIGFFRTHIKMEPGSGNMGRLAKTHSQHGASEPAPAVHSRKISTIHAPLPRKRRCRELGFARKHN
jgi:hypothetical protein